MENPLDAIVDRIEKERKERIRKFSEAEAEGKEIDWTDPEWAKMLNSKEAWRYLCNCSQFDWMDCRSRKCPRYDICYHYLHDFMV